MIKQSNTPQLKEGGALTSLTREDVLSILAHYLEIVEKRVSSGRAPRDLKADAANREWMKHGTYMCSVALSGIRTAEQEQIEERINSLETLMGEVKV